MTLGSYNTFVVKIWCDDEKTIRGHIQHAGSSEYEYFIDWEKMISFMAKHIYQTPADNTGGTSSRVD